MSAEMSLRKTTLPTRCVGLALGLTIVGVSAPTWAEETWKSDWFAPEGFAMEVDAEAFDLPTSIAVVRNPGSNPKDPLYFVTELSGKVKVVTRDRSVFTFAENFFRVRPPIPPPSTWGEIGMGGIALDDENGYVFVTFLYQDASEVMRNGMVRFKSTPRVFGLKAESSTSFNNIFEGETSWVNYQIGPMIVNQGKLFVGVGDGGKPFNSQDLHYTTGKILRMSVDGTPLNDNPFLVDNDPKKRQNFVWAYGFRNVFGLALVNGRLFASENGIQVDRFLEIVKGENYNWDGTDWSLGINAAMVFGPTVGPVQLAWLPPDNTLFPAEYRSRFYMAMSYGQNLTTGVATLDYSFDKSRMNATPRRFVLLKPPPGGLDFSPDAIIQKVVGIAFGADGLYMVPMYPLRKESGARSAVLRITYDPKRAHPYVLDKDKAAETLMSKYACFYCHSRDPEKKKAALTLDDQTLVPRLLTELSSDRYAAQIKEMNAAGTAGDEFGGMRAKLMQAQGLDRVRLWIKGRLVNPQFDRKVSAMPAFNMSEADADTIAAFFIEGHANRKGVPVQARIKNALKRAVGTPRHMHSVVAGIAGLVFGLLLFPIGSYARRRLRGVGSKS